jgi:WD40 repeat protein
MEEVASEIVPSAMDSKKNKSRTTGLTLRVSFQKHEEAITGLIPFSHKLGNGPDLPYLLSTSTDRHIYIYNLTSGKYCSAFHNPLLTHNSEIAADGPITAADVAYDLNEFAYASSDKCVYVRSLSNKGENMSLRMVLIGHEAEVTSVRLCKVTSRWVTVSEDGCVRFWSRESPICTKIIRTGVSIISMACDQLNGCILIATVDGLVKIVDPAQGEGEIVGKLEGHSDVVKDMIHIPDRRQYLTASSDGTIKVWNAYFKKGQRKWHALVPNGDDELGQVKDDSKQRNTLTVEVDEV